MSCNMNKNGKENIFNALCEKIIFDSASAVAQMDLYVKQITQINKYWEF